MKLWKALVLALNKRATFFIYVYSGCLAWYNVVLTPWIHSSLKYSQLGQSVNICDISKQSTCTLYMWKYHSDNK